jgi:hypothetical protein
MLMNLLRIKQTELRSFMKKPIRMEGLTLTVKNVERSVKYYEKIGFTCDWNAIPHFAHGRRGKNK